MTDCICPLCKRLLGKSQNEHHLVPKLKGGRLGPTVFLHKVCHSKIHSLFTETELASKYNTIEKLLGNEEIQKFIKWVSKKPIDFYDGYKKNKLKNGWR